MPKYSVRINRALKVYQTVTVIVEADDADHAKDLVSEGDEPEEDQWAEQDCSIENWEIEDVEEVA